MMSDLCAQLSTNLLGGEVICCLFQSGKVRFCDVHLSGADFLLNVFVYILKG